MSFYLFVIHPECRYLVWSRGKNLPDRLFTRTLRIAGNGSVTSMTRPPLFNPNRPQKACKLPYMRIDPPVRPPATQSSWVPDRVASHVDHCGPLWISWISEREKKKTLFSSQEPDKFHVPYKIHLLSPDLIPGISISISNSNSISISV